MEEIRAKICKCKVICLDEMDLNPITTNPKYMRPKDKNKLISLIEAKMKLDDTIINEEFNKVVLNSVLCEGSDYSNYPVYDRDKNQTEKIELEKDITDIAGNIMNKNTLK